ncbi:hypothetical protein ScPMuIL_003420 [Solemya velum]
MGYEEVVMPPVRRRGRCSQFIIDNLLIIMMIVAVAIGVGMGMGLREHWAYYEKRKMHFLRFPGDLLMNMLKMMILPLVFSSIISALASLDIKKSGKMGIVAIIYYMSTTLIAVIIGIILVLSIRPGELGNSDLDRKGKEKTANPYDALMDLIRNCFPPNLIAACFEKQVTSATPTNFTISNATDDYVTRDVPKVGTGSGTNILGIIVFSIFLGIIIAKMGEKGKPLVDFFESFSLAIIKLVTLIIWYAPFGIMFLIAAKVIEMEDPAKTFTQLAYYMLTVLAGLAVHGFIVLPLIYFIVVRRNPYKFMYNMVKALTTALATASSSATLPITMNCLQENNHIDERVTKMMAPIGATINMDGTALYEAVASIFIAQYNNITLDVGQVIIISLTSTAAAIGAAGIPEAGLVTMTIVLTAVGLPVEDVTLILAIDWFLDRCRTSINVLGDSFGAGIVDRLVLGPRSNRNLDNGIMVSGIELEDTVAYKDNKAFQPDTKSKSMEKTAL